jgi:hypothetical protein
MTKENTLYLHQSNLIHLMHLIYLLPLIHLMIAHSNEPRDTSPHQQLIHLSEYFVHRLDWLS